MKNLQYSEKLIKNKAKIIAGGAALVIIISLITFLSYFNITSVEVDGNTHYTDDEIKNMVLQGPFKSNSLLATHINTNKNTKDIPFIHSASVERESRSKIVIHVKEKQLIGYIRYLDGFLYFDNEGTISESMLQAAEDDVPYIEGLKFDRVIVGEQLQVQDKSVFNTILSLSRMISKNDILPDQIVFDDKYQIMLYYDKVQVSLGEDNYLEEKITHLTGILPELKGMDGLLHMENITTEARSITFEKNLTDEEKLEGTSSGEASQNTADTKAASGTIEKDNTDKTAEADKAKEASESGADSKTAETNKIDGTNKTDSITNTESTNTTDSNNNAGSINKTTGADNQ